MSNRGKGSHQHSGSQNHDRENYKRSVTGDICISGKVEADLPPKLIEAYKTSSRNEDAREGKRFIVEIVTLVFVIAVAVVSFIQMRASLRTARAAREANGLSLQAMQQSQRPWVGPDGDIPITSGPITIDDKGQISTIVRMTTDNFGSFGANNVFPYAELFVAQDISDIHSREKVVCDVATQNNQLGHILFPGQKRMRMSGWPALPAIPPITNTKMEHQDYRYQPYLLTCIGYRDQFGNPHHTGTIFSPVNPSTKDTLSISLDRNQSIPVEWMDWYSLLD